MYNGLQAFTLCTNNNLAVVQWGEDCYCILPKQNLALAQQTSITADICKLLYIYQQLQPRLVCLTV